MMEHLIFRTKFEIVKAVLIYVVYNHHIPQESQNVFIISNIKTGSVNCILFVLFTFSTDRFNSSDGFTCTVGEMLVNS